MTRDEQIWIAVKIWRWRDRFGGFEAAQFIEKELGLNLNEVQKAVGDRAFDALMVAAMRGIQPMKRIS